SEITPPEVYFSRRTLLAAALASAASGCVRAAGGEPAGAPLAYERNARYSVSEKPNTYDEITTYNNFYEFGTDTESPSEYARMMGRRAAVLNWPYVEGLRIDEAMHPLTLMVVGLYGRTLPNQDGAPLRLIVPWKYGFKSIKSIVQIRFTEREPNTAWNVAAPHEYGFYANVNPAVDHSRWSQATERRLGSPFLAARRPTLPFNGYAAEVAHLYQAMDLRR